MPNIGPTELIIVLVIVLLIFGPKRLPGLGQQLGGGMREFKDSITGKGRTTTTTTTSAERSDERRRRPRPPSAVPRASRRRSRARSSPSGAPSAAPSRIDAWPAPR